MNRAYTGFLKIIFDVQSPPYPHKTRLLNVSDANTLRIDIFINIKFSDDTPVCIDSKILNFVPIFKLEIKKSMTFVIGDAS